MKLLPRHPLPAPLAGKGQKVARIDGRLVDPPRPRAVEVPDRVEWARRDRSPAAA